jgi:hypothetical protein
MCIWIVSGTEIVRLTCRRLAFGAGKTFGTGTKRTEISPTKSVWFQCIRPTHSPSTTNATFWNNYVLTDRRRGTQIKLNWNVSLYFVKPTNTSSATAHRTKRVLRPHIFDHPPNLVAFWIAAVQKLNVVSVTFSKFYHCVKTLSLKLHFLLQNVKGTSKWFIYYCALQNVSYLPITGLLGQRNRSRLRNLGYFRLSKRSLPNNFLYKEGIRHFPSANPSC